MSIPANQSGQRLSPAAIEIAKQCGSLLSVARSIYCKELEPYAGQKWHVDVCVCDQPEKLMIEATWHELSFETELTGDLIKLARIVARDYEVAPYPMEWFTIKDRIAVMLKEELRDSHSYRTDEDAMNQLVLDGDQAFHPWFCDGTRLGVLDYLAKWVGHIPEGESTDYYRGLCHGFRVAMTLCAALAKLPPRPPELEIREELFLYLACKSAERGIGRTLPPLPFPAFRPVVPVSAVLRRNLVTPFRTVPVEIERLASKVDELFLSNKTRIEGIGPEVLNSQPATIALMQPGECSAFYAGAVHAIRVSERIAVLYENEIIPKSALDTLPLEQELHRLCCLAARYSVAASR